jgi:hypothetical protein
MGREVSRRRPRFLEGREITLADQRAWLFPLPDGIPRLVDEVTRKEYLGLLRAYAEGEDASERRLAELAFGIFLLDLNYEVGPTDLQALLTFPPGSRAQAELENAFRSLALDHLGAVAGAVPEPSPEPLPERAVATAWGRLLLWLKAQLSARRLSWQPPEGEAPL